MDILLEIIYFCSILVIGLTLRAIPHVKYYFPGTPDTFFFLNKIKNPEYLSEEVLYPKLFDQTLRLFARAGKLTDGRTTNRLSIVLDAITMSILYFFIRSNSSIEIALFTTLLFFISPFIVKQGSTLSARPFGLLLASTSVLLTTLPFPWNWSALVPIAMTLLAHRLSTQTLFVVYVGLSFLDIQFPLIFIAGFIFAVIVTKGMYIEILRAHVSAILTYYKQKGYPNDRVVGVLFTPAFFGYLLYLIFFIAQSYYSNPISIGGFIIPELLSFNILFELVMIIWASACFLLLIFWVAGESYKHLSIAAGPFAYLTSLLAFTNQFFLILAIIITFGSLVQSLYFQLRFEHVDKNLVELLDNTSLVGEHGTMFAPSKVYRAVSFLTDCEVVPVNLHLYNQDHFDKRFLEYNPTLAVEERKYGFWYSDWEEVDNSGDWVLFRLK